MIRPRSTSSDDSVAKVVTTAGVHAAAATAPSHPSVLAASHTAFVSGLHLILLIGAAPVALGSVAAFVLIRAQDFYAQPAHATPPVVESNAA